MKIKITTDSTCDLPAEVLREREITVVPLGIVKDGELFRDGVDITTADIAAHVDGGGEITTTSAVNIAGYEELFSAFADAYDAVIHVNIGAGFSSCHQNARIAAENFSNVYPVDSANLSAGHGLMVLAASDAARSGASPEEICARLAALAPKLEASFVLDRLDYMQKGGRCSAVAALGAKALKLHPCIEVVSGRMTVVKKYRGSMERVIAEYIRERLGERDDIDTTRVLVVHSCRTAGLTETALEVLRQDGRFDVVLAVPAGCTIFSHRGPDALGIIFSGK